jgi:hypothetical protein
LVETFRKEETTPRQHPEHGKGLLPQRVFQQPQAFTLKCPAQSQMSVMAMSRQLTNR